MTFFGIAFILHYDEEDDADITETTRVVSKLPQLQPKISIHKVAPVPGLLSMEDEEVVREVVSGSIPSYSVKSKLGYCLRAALIRNQAVEIVGYRSRSSSEC
ncbi:unnamed protein product [Trifolium pratense]|uniref:Uncharacterized protein n=1 Tax=Trifolium pratense TaxID=57577 RepID=A0ACB0JTQ8_TRIPR|nr:unnamed protein product [Trifolium pratense]